MPRLRTAKQTALAGRRRMIGERSPEQPTAYNPIYMTPGDPNYDGPSRERLPYDPDVDPTAPPGDTPPDLGTDPGMFMNPGGNYNDSGMGFNPPGLAGDGDSGGGGGWGSKGGWRAEVLQDPTYAAFERQFEYNRSKIGSDFIALKERLKRDAERYDVKHRMDRRDGLQGINKSMENRGLYRSGQRHTERGDLKNRFSMNRQNFRDEQGERREEARRNKREGIADLKRDRAEERLDARSRLTDRDATTEYMA